MNSLLNGNACGDDIMSKGLLPTEDQMIENMALMLREKMAKDYPQGATKRDAHPKSLGLLKAEFTVMPNLPDDLRVGIFKEARAYLAFIRFSNASNKVQSDARKDFRGFAIKLLGVQGEKFMPDEKVTQDFILLSNPTMPLGTVELFHQAIYYAIKKNPVLLLAKMLLEGNASILKELIMGMKHDSSPLDIRYWSTTPYQFGDRIVKYSIVPKSIYKSSLARKRSAFYLAENMQRHLAMDEAAFDFMVQFQTDAELMPVEDAATLWQESDSPFIKLAEIRIPQQLFRSSERETWAENLSFSPAHCLFEHRPLGGINRARIKIYKTLSEFRHTRDGRSLVEPSEDDYHSLS